MKKKTFFISLFIWPLLYLPAQAQTAIAVGEPSACNLPNLIGKQADSIDKAQFGERAVRILRPNQAATMDYSPTRLNLITDDNGVITSMNCG